LDHCVVGGIGFDVPKCKAACAPATLCLPLCEAGACPDACKTYASCATLTPEVAPLAVTRYCEGPEFNRARCNDACRGGQLCNVACGSDNFKDIFDCPASCASYSKCTVLLPVAANDTVSVCAESGFDREACAARCQPGLPCADLCREGGFQLCPTQCKSYEPCLSLAPPGGSDQCPQVLCLSDCKLGFRNDDKGCPTCQCVKPAVCKAADIDCSCHEKRKECEVCAVANGKWICVQRPPIAIEEPKSTVSPEDVAALRKNKDLGDGKTGSKVNLAEKPPDSEVRWADIKKSASDEGAGDALSLSGAGSQVTVDEDEIGASPPVDIVQGARVVVEKVFRPTRLDLDANSSVVVTGGGRIVFGDEGFGVSGVLAARGKVRVGSESAHVDAKFVFRGTQSSIDEAANGAGDTDVVETEVEIDSPAECEGNSEAALNAKVRFANGLKMQRGSRLVCSEEMGIDGNFSAEGDGDVHIDASPQNAGAETVFGNGSTADVKDSARLSLGTVARLACGAVMRVGTEAQLSFLNTVLSEAADGSPCGKDRPVEVNVGGKMHVEGDLWDVDGNVKLSGEGEVAVGNGADASALQLTDQADVPWQSVRVKAEARIVVRKTGLAGGLTIDLAASASVEGSSTVQRFDVAGQVTIKPLLADDQTVVRGDFQANGDQSRLEFAVGDHGQDKAPLVDVQGAMTGALGAITVSKGDCDRVAQGGIILMRWTAGNPQFPTSCTITCTPSGTDINGRRREATSCESPVTTKDGQAVVTDSACASGSTSPTDNPNEEEQEASGAAATVATATLWFVLGFLWLQLQ